MAASLAVWVLLGLLVVLWSLVVLFVFLGSAWWDRDRRVVGRTFRFLAVLALRAVPFWHLEVVGRLPELRDRPYVVVCNHESLADLMAVGSLPREMKWLSKAAVGWIPFLGQMMWMAGDVLVRRSDSESRARAFEKLRKWVERGVPVVVFPEGTRSTTGRLLPFRNGAFRLAIATGAPILPLALSGARAAMRKGSIVFRPCRLRLAILEPVPVDGLGPGDVERLRDLVRDRIEAARGC